MRNRRESKYESTCQVGHCTGPANAELVLAPDAAVYVCNLCNTDEVRQKLRAGNAAIYIYQGRRIVLSCAGEAPATHRPAASDEILEVYQAGMWEPYWLECRDCRERFVHDQLERRGRASMFCESCAETKAEQAFLDKNADAIAAEAADMVKQENERAAREAGKPPWYPGTPLWEQIKERYALAAREAYEERAAIMEYDGGLPRAEAEQRAYLIQMDKVSGRPDLLRCESQ